MKTEDIIGKEFIGVRFEDTSLLRCDYEYDKFIGITGNVKAIHSYHPECALVSFLINGKNIQRHWPTSVVLDQIEEKERKQAPDYIKNLFEKVLSLTFYTNIKRN